MSKPPAKQAKPEATTDDYGRRKWDKEAFSRAARERLEMEEMELERQQGRQNTKPVMRPALQARQHEVDLGSKLHTSRVVDSIRSKGAGYFCEVCDVLCKDSNNYLDHINSKKHLDCGTGRRCPQVDQEKQAKVDYNIDKAMALMQDEDERRKREKRQRKKEAKRQRAEVAPEDDDVDAEEIDPALAAMMGFQGFGK
ncbi:uncharacterized protein MONBRDRAFT_33398 [Monosiga brevicollis MX1]|uniref:U1-type domain-containing protein n=1 Tax=Monosiga brevicollis TaxID=81824 RepID=A9V567_MONBE|nr:uncharacterized protein MONBRDRAFT_33398 [Monosiga brevicollis MX1]EDQ87222.1 predicted protein [Monosiga brevicollis MX1]|eukprot:XP_001747835.1 hypothetical protein [Monosiga brevicollis MX1]